MSILEIIEAFCFKYYGSCNSENFQSITRTHKSRNAQVVHGFPITHRIVSPVSSVCIVFHFEIAMVITH